MNTENTMFADLLAAQMEMPTLQKSAINPHFGNRFIPLDELIPAVLPILNKHGLVLLQQPTTADGRPALRTVLLHTSGEVMESTMLLQATKDDPQQQGSAITYARRYSLLSWLGLVADMDDDAETHRTTTAVAPPQGRTFTPRPAPDSPNRPGIPAPECPAGHGTMKLRPAGTSQRTGKAYGAFWGCQTRECKKTVDAAEWEGQVRQLNSAPEPFEDAPLPFE